MIEMRLKRNNKDNVANAILEYAVTLGIVAAVFVGMNIYLKRGMQAKLKDMTDYFIGDTQLVEVDPTTSSQTRETTSGVFRQRFTGGGTREVASSTDNIVNEAEVIVPEQIEPPNGTSAPGGHTAPLPYTDNPSAGLPNAGGQ